MRHPQLDASAMASSSSWRQTCTSRSAARASSQDSLDALPLLQGMQHKEGLGVVPSSAMVTAGRAAVHADQEAAASAHQCWSRSRRRE